VRGKEQSDKKNKFVARRLDQNIETGGGANGDRELKFNKRARLRRTFVSLASKGKPKRKGGEKIKKRKSFAVLEGDSTRIERLEKRKARLRHPFQEIACFSACILLADNYRTFSAGIVPEGLRSQFRRTQSQKKTSLW